MGLKSRVKQGQEKRKKLERIRKEGPRMVFASGFFLRATIARPTRFFWHNRKNSQVLSSLTR